MIYFVSADIHGFFDEWQNALKEKHFDINNPNHKIIICGDLFDRGRQPKEIIDYVLNHKDKIILIRGNHEDLMEEMIKRNFYGNHDLHNGTVQTIIDLYPEWLISEFNLSKIATVTHLKEILDLCIDYYETNHYIFVHGWIPISIDGKTYNPNWRNAHKKEWQDARWANPVLMYRNSVYVPNKIIVCGHWHCSALWHELNPIKYSEFGDTANFEPFITEHMIALDACTVHSNKVNVVVLED